MESSAPALCLCLCLESVAFRSAIAGGWTLPWTRVVWVGGAAMGLPLVVVLVLVLFFLFSFPLLINCLRYSVFGFSDGLTNWTFFLFIFSFYNISVSFISKLRLYSLFFLFFLVCLLCSM